MFALSVLLSSQFIYNSVGSIDEAALDRLSLVAELTRTVRVQADATVRDAGDLALFAPSVCRRRCAASVSEQRLQLLPLLRGDTDRAWRQFLWLVRDFALRLVADGAPITPTEYLERALRPVRVRTDGARTASAVRPADADVDAAADWRIGSQLTGRPRRS